MQWKLSLFSNQSKTVIFKIFMLLFSRLYIVKKIEKNGMGFANCWSRTVNYSCKFLRHCGFWWNKMVIVIGFEKKINCQSLRPVLIKSHVIVLPFWIVLCSSIKLWVTLFSHGWDRLIIRCTVTPMSKVRGSTTSQSLYYSGSCWLLFVIYSFRLSFLSCLMFLIFWFELFFICNVGVIDSWLYCWFNNSKRPKSNLLMLTFMLVWLASSLVIIPHFPIFIL